MSQLADVPQLRIKRVPSPFTPEEILEYLAFIKWTPLPALPEPDAAHNWLELQPTLANLERLARAHLLAFPYENTEKHYTLHKNLSYRPRDIFERVVRAGRGLGSGCLGLNMLFKGILQGLGYLCYTTAARINFDWDMASPPKFCGMGHTVNIVLPIDGPDGTAPVPHVVDVGYGGHGDISMLYRPLPLIDGTVVSSFTPPEEHRLLRATRPDDECALAESGWVLQVRVAPSEPWRLSYWINLAEFTETDWEWINFSMSKLPTAPMYNMLVCIKLHELPTGEIARTSIWSARAVRKVGAKKEVLERWEWEEERIDGISRLCGMKLDMREAIAGAREKPGMALPIREDAQLDGRCDAINTSLLN